MDSLIAAAFDRYLTEFEVLIPTLVKAYDELPAADPLKAKLAEQVALLRAWDLRWSLESVATTIAVYWVTISGSGSRRTPGRRGIQLRIHRKKSLCAPAARIAGGSLRQAHRGRGNLEDAVGRCQSTPAHQRKHRPAVRRQGAEHPRRLRVGTMGSLASFGRAPPRDQEDVRHERQQLSCRRRVRRPRAGESDHRRRRKRRSIFAALQRSIIQVRHRQFARRILLPGPIGRPYRTTIPSRRVTFSSSRQERLQPYGRGRRGFLELVGPIFIGEPLVVLGDLLQIS